MTIGGGLELPAAGSSKVGSEEGASGLRGKMWAAHLASANFARTISAKGPVAESAGNIGDPQVAQAYPAGAVVLGRALQASLMQFTWNRSRQGNRTRSPWSKGCLQS